MFTAIYLVYLIATLTECIHQTFANLMQDGNFQLDSNEVFVIAFPLLPYKKQLHSSNQLHVTFSQSDYADLPTWIKYTTINETVLLYGKSPTAEPLSLAMILHESYLMETLVESISLNFAGQPANNNTIMNEVHLRLSNTNLFDFHSRKQELISVFRDHLWTGDPSVKYTLIARPQDVSARLPLNPNDKEGVIIRIGSTRRFSKDLLRLDQEMKPIRRRPQCPAHYRSASFEYLFRQKQFQVDWCSFQLLTYSQKEALPDSNQVSEQRIVGPPKESSYPSIQPVHYEMMAVNHLLIPAASSILCIYAFIWAIRPVSHKMESKFRSTTVYL